MTFRLVYKIVVIAIPLSHVLFTVPSDGVLVLQPEPIEITQIKEEPYRSYVLISQRAKRLRTSDITCFDEKVNSWKVIELLECITTCPPEAMQSLALLDLINGAVFNYRGAINKVLETIKPYDREYLEGAIRLLIGFPRAYESLSYYYKNNLSPGPCGDIDQFHLTGLIFACIKGFIDPVAKQLQGNKSWQNKVLPYPLKVRHQYEACWCDWSTQKCFIEKRTFPLFLGYTKEQHSCPLHAAVDFSRHEIVHILLKKGFNPLLPDLDGDTALAIAMRNPPVKPTYGESHFIGDLEARKKSRLILKLFSKYSANSKDEGCPLIITHILMAGTTENENGTGFYFFRNHQERRKASRHETIASVALKLCPALISDVIRDDKGNTPLHSAVLANNPYLIDLILSIECGTEGFNSNSTSALFDAENEANKTPVQLALQEEKWEALSSLATSYYGNKEILKAVILTNSQKGVEVFLKKRVGDAHSLYLKIPKIILFAISTGKFNALRGIVNAAYQYEKERREAEQEAIEHQRQPDNSLTTHLVATTTSLLISGLSLLRLL